MDEVTRHFELINYSEWGTEVNGVLYACDLSPRPQETPASAITLRLNAREPEQRRINGELTLPSGDEGPCRCRSGRGAGGAGGAGGAEGAWEGSALVPPQPIKI
ncbi:hypothetical protein evm_004050 [Chilo suppressalis]|nr:hypothetical protein evm_004050 [Chilo suppressalis]